MPDETFLNAIQKESLRRIGERMLEGEKAIQRLNDLPSAVEGERITTEPYARHDRAEAMREAAEQHGKAALRKRIEEQTARAEKAEAALAAARKELDELRESFNHAQTTIKYDNHTRLVTIITKLAKGETRRGEPVPLARFVGALELPVHILED